MQNSGIKRNTTFRIIAVTNNTSLVNNISHLNSTSSSTRSKVCVPDKIVEVQIITLKPPTSVTADEFWKDKVMACQISVTISYDQIYNLLLLYYCEKKYCSNYFRETNFNQNMAKPNPYLWRSVKLAYLSLYAWKKKTTGGICYDT